METFKAWAKDYVQWQENQGQEIDFICFNALMTARFNPFTGLISVKPETQVKGQVIVVEIQKGANNTQENLDIQPILWQ